MEADQNVTQPSTSAAPADRDSDDGTDADAPKKRTKSPAQVKLDELLNEQSLVFIHYMRFARRAEKDGIVEARKIFSRARKTTPSCRYHVFVAAALTEYFSNKDTKLASLIFNHGMAQFADDPDFILHYVEFLFHLNDDSSLLSSSRSRLTIKLTRSLDIRQVYERSIGVIPPERATELWSSYLYFEAMYGELSSVRALEKRRAEAFPDGTIFRHLHYWTSC